jgi:hypothetical protein
MMLRRRDPVDAKIIKLSDWNRSNAAQYRETFAEIVNIVKDDGPKVYDSQADFDGWDDAS